MRLLYCWCGESIGYQKLVNKMIEWMGQRLSGRTFCHPAHNERIVCIQGVDAMLKINQFVLSALASVAFVSGCVTVTLVSGAFLDISPMAAQAG